MDRKLAIAEVTALLYHPFVDPEERELFLPNLPSLSDNDLQELQKNYAERIHSFEELNSLLASIRTSGDTIVNRQALIAKNAAAHPLYDLHPSNIVSVLSAKIVNYLQQGIDIGAEYDLYLDSQNEFARSDGDDFQSVGPADVRKSFLDAFKRCQTPLPEDPLHRSISAWIQNYEASYPLDKGRGDSERLAFLGQQKLPAHGYELLVKLIEGYDHIALSADLVNTLEEVPGITEVPLRVVEEKSSLPDLTPRAATKNVPKPAVLPELKKTIPPAIPPSPRTVSQPVAATPAPAVTQNTLYRREVDQIVGAISLFSTDGQNALRLITDRLSRITNSGKDSSSKNEKLQKALKTLQRFAVIKSDPLLVKSFAQQKSGVGEREVIAELGSAVDSLEQQPPTGNQR